MKGLINEINRNRSLMGLSLLNESVISEGTGLGTMALELANTIDRVTIKKALSEIVDKYAAKFPFNSSRAKTMFLNGGLNSLKNALGKVTQKEALEIIVSIDKAAMGKLINIISKAEPEIISDVERLIGKGAADDAIIDAYASSDIPETVVKNMIDAAKFKVLFSPERITAAINSLSGDVKKNLKDLGEKAISVYRSSNPNATEQEVAEYFLSQLPDKKSWYTPVVKFLGDATKPGANMLSKFFYNLDEKGQKVVATKRILLTIGVGGAAITMTGLFYYLYNAYVVPNKKDSLDLLLAKYPCWTGYMIPAEESDTFMAEMEDGKKVLVKWDGKRAWFTKKVNGNLINTKELSCTN